MKLFHKVFLTIVICSAVLLSVTSLMFFRSVNLGFSQYIEAIEQSKLEGIAANLKTWYAQDTGWSRLAEAPRRFADVSRPGSTRERRNRRDPSSDRRGDRPRPPAGHPPPRRPLDDPMGLGPRMTLFDANRQYVAGRRQPFNDRVYFPIEVGGAEVGYLSLGKLEGLELALQQGFLVDVRNQLLVVGGLALLLSLLLAFALSRHILAPVEKIAGIANRLIKRDFSARTPVEGKDEIGRLGTIINTLARSLEEAEGVRERWVADIAHELRTPITIIRAELEGMQDGVIEINSSSIESLQEEIFHLSKLVDDLRQLALSDAGELQYRWESVDLGKEVQTQADKFSKQFETAGIELEVTRPAPAPLCIWGDRERIRQLLANLMENSLRYTDRGGRLEVRISVNGDRLNVAFADTAPSVNAAHLPRLFDRLYRVEQSRSRSTGGSGLGLAMVRTIVQAHRGSVTAKASNLGGVQIELEFPLLKP